MSMVETYFGPDGPDQQSARFDAHSFVEFLRRSHPRWQDEDRKSVHSQHWVYRGHEDEAYPLLPSAARQQKFNKLGPTIEFVKKRLDDLEAFVETSEFPKASAIIEEQRSQLAYVLAYGFMMKNFAQLGSDLGFFSGTFDGLEPRFFSDDLLSDDYIREAVLSTNEQCGGYALKALGFYKSWLNIYPRFNSELTSLAQHHGMPTFLLDWTQNPWVAAFFAATPASGFAQEKSISVWALNTLATERVDLDADGIALYDNNSLARITAYKPSRFGNTFLASQSGLFTSISSFAKDWSKGYPHLESVIKEFSKHDSNSATLWDDDDSEMKQKDIENKRQLTTRFPSGKVLLRKVVLEAVHLPELRRLLRVEGITRAQLMPTLDGLAQSSLSIASDELNFVKPNTLY
jgi:hypothetical protein